MSLLALALLCAGPAAADSAQCTLNDMRLVTAAVGAWVTDQTGLDAARRGGPTFDLEDYPAITFGALETLLVPTYLDVLPAVDAWGNPFDYRLNPDLLSPNLFAVRSLGADGLAEGNLYSPGFTSDPDEDLLNLNGFLIRQPQPLPQFAQEFTVERIRDVGLAMLAWLTDIVSVQPAMGPLTDLGGSFDISLFVPILPGALELLLVPSYLPWLPEADGWGNPLEFYVDVLNPLGVDVLAVRSAGSDGVVSGDLYIPGGFPFLQDIEDIVWADGLFIRFPLGGPVFVDDFESGDVCAWAGSLP